MSWLKEALSAATTIYAQKKNKKNEQQAVQAEQSATAAELDGIAESRRQFDATRSDALALREQARPAIEYITSTLSEDPSQLSPMQQRQAEEANRLTAQKIRSTSMGGSGRATTAAIRDVQADLRARFIQDNQRRSDAAATSLAPQFFNNNAVATANRGAAETSLKGGSARAAGDRNTAGIRSDASNANTNLLTKYAGDMAGSRADDALSAIRAITASDKANEQRDSRYKTYDEYGVGYA